MQCLLFGFGCCDTGVEGNAAGTMPESATADHLKRKAKNKCRFLRGAGFGNLVERFFENPCRFLTLHVAVREWRGQANTGSRYRKTERYEKFFKKFQN